MQAADHLQQTDRTYVRLGRRKLSYFSGCDYFRLSSDPRVLNATRAALDTVGLNVSASRATTGDHAAYGQLERALERYFKVESATLVASGYLAGLTFGQALKGTVTRAFIDECAHPALHDAALTLECPITFFKHQDPVDLERRVTRFKSKKRIVVLTDGMFASDGSTAPLAEYLEVMPTQALLVVDDAHGAGVLGLHGRGTPEHCGLRDRRIIQLITLSKAFGTFGGAILATKHLSEGIRSTSRAFIGSTPMPLPLVGASLESVRILARQGLLLRKRLASNARFVRERLRLAGVHAPELPGPIIALRLRAQKLIAALQSALFETGIYPPYIRYPGAPKEGIFRFVLSSEHSTDQLTQLSEVLSAHAWLLKAEEDAIRFTT